jgi:DNA modification methylase
MSYQEVINRKKKWAIVIGDALKTLKTMPKDIFQTSITSPPYFNLRDYETPNQIGTEKSPKEYIERIVEIYKEVKRTLRKDGTCWINIGDKYASHQTFPELYIKDKDLMGIPWELARALRKDRWHVRQMIPWVKQNAVPEKASDRPNTSIEYIIFLTKNKTYYFDMEGAKECLGIKRNWRNGDSLLFMDVPTERHFLKHPAMMPDELARIMLKSSLSQEGCCSKCYTPFKRKIKKIGIPGRTKFTEKSKYYSKTGPNSVTSLSSYVKGNGRTNTIVETLGWEPQCKCNANKTRQLVLDPFSGAATTGNVSLELGHGYIGIELYNDYAQESISRLRKKEESTKDIFS